MVFRFGARRGPAAVLAAVLATGGLLLAGCGGDSDSIPFAQSSSPASPSASASAATGTVATTGPSAPLKLGASATVAFDQAGQTTTVQVTTLSVTKGKISDFADFQLDAEQKSSTPYYVRATFGNVGHRTLKRPGMNKLLFAFAADGTRATPVTAPGFHLCDASEPDQWGPGGLLTECASYLVPAGAAVTTVTFQANNHQDAVVWKTTA